MFRTSKDTQTGHCLLRNSRIQFWKKRASEFFSFTWLTWAAEMLEFQKIEECHCSGSFTVKYISSLLYLDLWTRIRCKRITAFHENLTIIKIPPLSSFWSNIIGKADLLWREKLSGWESSGKNHKISRCLFISSSFQPSQSLESSKVRGNLKTLIRPMLPKATQVISVFFHEVARSISSLSQAGGDGSPLQLLLEPK